MRTPLLADLERALELLQQVDEGSLDIAPDPNVSADIRELTGLQAYPVDSHLANLRARIEAFRLRVDANRRLRKVGTAERRLSAKPIYGLQAGR
jgi:hypothetical protein